MYELPRWTGGKESICQCSKQVLFLNREDSLEKEMAIHSSILPVKLHGQRSLSGYSPGGCKSQTAVIGWAHTHTHTHTHTHNLYTNYITLLHGIRFLFIYIYVCTNAFICFLSLTKVFVHLSSFIHSLIDSTTPFECLIYVLYLVLEANECVWMYVFVFVRAVLVNGYWDNITLTLSWETLQSSVICNHNGLWTLQSPNYSGWSTLSVE